MHNFILNPMAFRFASAHKEELLQIDPAQPSRPIHRKMPSRTSRRDRSPSPLLIALRRIASPILNFCTVSTDTLDKFVELCAGTNAITRIERARSIKLIEKLSKVLDPEHIGVGQWADATGGRFTGVREATPSLVTPWKDPHFGVVYRYRLDRSPEPPIYTPPPGSGSLCGLLFTTPTASRPASPPAQKSFPTSQSEVSFSSIIEDHSAGRTNLANRFKSSNRFDAEHYNGIPSCPEVFISNPKRSCIAAQLFYEHQEPEGDSGDWVEEAEDIKVKKKTTKGRASVRGRETRAGRRPVKFLGVGLSKEKGVQSQDVKQVEKNEPREGFTDDDCAVESCDEEDCDLEMKMEQQKQRKRYHD